MTTNSFSSFVGEGGDFIAAFESLTFGQTTRKNTSLPPAATPPAIPARSGTSLPIAKPVATGGGIASPLTETAYASRTWHAVKTIVSSDGLLHLRVKPIKAVTFTDANGATVVMDYKAPP